MVTIQAATKKLASLRCHFFPQWASISITSRRPVLGGSTSHPISASILGLKEPPLLHVCPSIALLPQTTHSPSHSNPSEPTCSGEGRLSWYYFGDSGYSKPRSFPKALLPPSPLPPSAAGLSHITILSPKGFHSAPKLAEASVPQRTITTTHLVLHSRYIAIVKTGLFPFFPCCRLYSNKEKRRTFAQRCRHGPQRREETAARPEPRTGQDNVGKLSVFHR